MSKQQSLRRHLVPPVIDMKKAEDRGQDLVRHSINVRRLHAATRNYFHTAAVTAIVNSTLLCDDMSTLPLQRCNHVKFSQDPCRKQYRYCYWSGTFSNRLLGGLLCLLYQQPSSECLSTSANRIKNPAPIMPLHTCLPALKHATPQRRRPQQNDHAACRKLGTCRCLLHTVTRRCPHCPSASPCLPLPCLVIIDSSTLGRAHPQQMPRLMLYKHFRVPIRQLLSCGVRAIAAAGLRLQVDALPCSGLQLRFDHLVQIVAAVHCRPPAVVSGRALHPSRWAAH